MTVRRISPDYPNWGAMLSLLQGAFAYMEARLGHPARVMSLTEEDLVAASRAGSVFVCEDDATPCACLFTRPSRDITDALYLGWIAVAPQHRGRGLASDLVDAAAQEACRKGYKKLTLDTGQALSELHTAFEKLGFTPVRHDGDIVTFVRSL